MPKFKVTDPKSGRTITLSSATDKPPSKEQLDEIFSMVSSSVAQAPQAPEQLAPDAAAPIAPTQAAPEFKPSLLGELTGATDRPETVSFKQPAIDTAVGMAKMFPPLAPFATAMEGARAGAKLPDEVTEYGLPIAASVAAERMIPFVPSVIKDPAGAFVGGMLGKANTLGKQKLRGEIDISNEQLQSQALETGLVDAAVAGTVAGAALTAPRFLKLVFGNEPGKITEKYRQKIAKLGMDKAKQLMSIDEGFARKSAALIKQAQGLAEAMTQEADKAVQAVGKKFPAIARKNSQLFRDTIQAGLEKGRNIDVAEDAILERAQKIYPVDKFGDYADKVINQLGFKGGADELASPLLDEFGQPIVSSVQRTKTVGELWDAIQRQSRNISQSGKTGAKVYSPEDKLADDALSLIIDVLENPADNISSGIKEFRLAREQWAGWAPIRNTAYRMSRPYEKGALRTKSGTSLLKRGALKQEPSEVRTMKALEDTFGVDLSGLRGKAGQTKQIAEELKSIPQQKKAASSAVRQGQAETAEALRRQKFKDVSGAQLKQRLARAATGSGVPAYFLYRLLKGGGFNGGAD